jgi:hypothetical protein
MNLESTPSGPKGIGMKAPTYRYLARTSISVERTVPGARIRSFSVVTSKVFYGPDLNKIASTIRANQRASVSDPPTPSQQLFVDDDGNIVFGDQLDGAPGRHLSRVTQETFYSQERYARERAIVEAKLPSGTQFATDDDIGGWLYSITNDLGDTYDLFLWYEVASGTYKVSLVEPRLGGTVGVHDCHLYPDGTLCLKEQGGAGYRDLADAYARSVIWTLGASCYRRGYGFQFNYDQAS